MKTYSQFIREAYGKFIPIDASKQSPTAIANILAARRKAEEEEREKSNFRNATSFHTGWSKEQKIKAIMAGSPGMSREEAAKKAALRIGKQKKVDEAISTNDPNRGKPGRKKPIVPPGLDPYDSVHPFTGKRVKSSGKVQKRLSTLSDAGRNEYYKKFGIRSRAASRGGKTQRLYWGLYEEEEKKKDRYEGEESTSSMIARLVARRHRKLGMKVPADVERDIDPKYKTKED